MRKYITILLFLSFIQQKAQNILITSSSGIFSITCANADLTLTAISQGFSATSTFSWTSPSMLLTGSVVTINASGNYSVAVNNGTAVVQTTLSVYINTTSPVSSISSTFLVAGSNSAIPSVTATAVSPTVNIRHEFYSPVGGTVVANGTSAIYPPAGPGTYTHCIFNLENGCSSCRNFTVILNPVGLDNLEISKDLRISSLPGSLIIESTTERTLQVVELSGRIVHLLSLRPSEPVQLVLTPGIFFLRDPENGTLTRKVLVSP